jgi:hypothetical protein
LARFLADLMLATVKSWVVGRPPDRVSVVEFRLN